MPMNPNSLKALAEHRYKKGQSGNPAGRRKNLPVTAEYELVLKEKLSATKLGKEIAEEYGLKPSATWARAIALGMAKESVTNHSAAREMREPIEGKALHRLRIEGSEDNPVKVEVQTENELRSDIVALIERLKSRGSNPGGTGGTTGQASAA